LTARCEAGGPFIEESLYWLPDAHGLFWRRVGEYSVTYYAYRENGQVASTEVEHA